jgi:hypothetical protein
MAIEITVRDTGSGETRSEAIINDYVHLRRQPLSRRRAGQVRDRHVRTDGQDRSPRRHRGPAAIAPTVPPSTAARRAELYAERVEIERRHYRGYLRLAEIRAALDEVQEQALDG